MSSVCYFFFVNFCFFFVVCIHFSYPRCIFLNLYIAVTECILSHLCSPISFTFFFRSSRCCCCCCYFCLFIPPIVCIAAHNALYISNAMHKCTNGYWFNEPFKSYIYIYTLHTHVSKNTRKCVSSSNSNRIFPI